MPYIRQTFGIGINTLRTGNGQTQEQLSGLAGIARSHLAALESGEKIPRADTLWRLAEALSVRPGELVRMTEQAMEERRKSGPP